MTHSWSSSASDSNAMNEARKTNLNQSVQFPNTRFSLDYSQLKQALKLANLGII
jgi:hypothetical protein